MDRIKREDFKSLAIVYIASAALIYLGSWAPIVLIPVPFMLVYAVARAGMGAGGAAAVLSFGTAALFNWSAALVSAAAFLPVAFAAGYMIRQKKRFRDSVLVSIAAVFLGAVIVIAIPQITGGTAVDYVVNSAGESMSALESEEINMLYQIVRYPDVFTGAITQRAVLDTPAAQAVQIMQKMLRDMLDVWLVTIIGTYSLLTGLLCYTIPRALVKKIRQVAPAPAFSDYELPKRFWAGFALSYLFAIVGSSLGWKSFDIVGLTVYNLYALVFAIQALSFLDFIYKKRKMGSGARTVLHVLSALVLSFVLMWIGIFENAFGMRRRINMGDQRSV